MTNYTESEYMLELTANESEHGGKNLLEPDGDSDDRYDDSMDGDFDSAMTSAGMGTDEDYGFLW